MAGETQKNSSRLDKLKKAIAEMDRKVDEIQKTLATIEYPMGHKFHAALESSREQAKSQSDDGNFPCAVFQPKNPEKSQPPKEPEVGHGLMSPIKLPRTPKRPPPSLYASTPRKRGAEDEPSPGRKRRLEFRKALNYGIIPEQALTTDAGTDTVTLNNKKSPVSSSTSSGNASENPFSRSPAPFPALAENLRPRLPQTSIRRPVTREHHPLHLPRLGSPLRISRSAVLMEEEEEEEEEAGDKVDVPMADKPARLPTEDSDQDASEM